MKNKIVGVLAALIFGLLVYAGFNSMLIPAFSIGDFQAYERDEGEGITTQLYLIPDNLMILQSQSEGLIINYVFEIFGRSKPHYIGPVFENEDDSFCLHWNANDAYNIQIEVIEARTTMTNMQGVLAPGDINFDELLIYDDEINFGGVLYSAYVIEADKRDAIIERAKKAFNEYSM